MSEGPFTFREARATAHQASQRQIAGEKALRQAAINLAEAERLFRKALALKSVELHAAGTAWTAVDSLARGDDKVATLRYQRDVAKGVCDAASSALYRLQADRRSQEQFVRWSMARELSDPGSGA